MDIEKICESVINILTEEEQEIILHKIDKESNFFRINLKRVDISTRETLAVEIFKMIGREMRFTIYIEEKVLERHTDGLFLPGMYTPYYYNVDSYGDDDRESVLNIDYIGPLNLLYDKIILRLKNEVCSIL